MVGRSRARFEPELQALRAINPKGEYIFIESETNLIKDIDAVCEQIKSKVSRIDLLFTASGYIGFDGRQNNADGLDVSMSLRWYGRVRFTQNLLPLMKPNGRAVTILAGGLEGKLFEDDLDLETNYTITNSLGHIGTALTLSYDKLAEQNPDVAFVHVWPGLVNTGTFSKATGGILGFFFRWIVEPIAGLFATTPADSGERMLYYAMSEAAKKGVSMDQNGNIVEVKALKEYREKGLADKVMEHNLKIFERATAAQ